MRKRKGRKKKWERKRKKENVRDNERKKEEKKERIWVKKKKKKWKESTKKKLLCFFSFILVTNLKFYRTSSAPHPSSMRLGLFSLVNFKTSGGGRKYSRILTLNGITLLSYLVDIQRTDLSHFLPKLLFFLLLDLLSKQGYYLPMRTTKIFFFIKYPRHSLSLSLYIYIYIYTTV